MMWDTRPIQAGLSRHMHEGKRGQACLQAHLAPLSTTTTGRLNVASHALLKDALVHWRKWPSSPLDNSNGHGTAHVMHHQKNWSKIMCALPHFDLCPNLQSMSPQQRRDPGASSVALHRVWLFNLQKTIAFFLNFSPVAFAEACITLSETPDHGHDHIFACCPCQSAGQWPVSRLIGHCQCLQPWHKSDV